MRRREFLQVASIGVAPFAAQQSVAAAYPDRPVRMVVGFPPGGGADVVARLLGPRLSTAVSQQFVIENRAGATGTIAAAYVAKAATDGYTLLVSAVSTNVIAPLLYSKLPYDSEKDLSPITLLASVPQVIAVHPSLPIHSVSELVAYAKANPNELKFGSAGNGSTPHITGEWFKQRTGTQLIHVPYKGAGQALPDLLAGRVPVSFDTTGTILAYIKAGQLRPLAIAAPRRFSPLPRVPTTAEAGLDGFTLSTWIGLFAPAGTPTPIVSYLHAQCAGVLNQTVVSSQLVELAGSDDSVTASPKDFADLLKTDREKYARIINIANIKLD